MFEENIKLLKNFILMKGFYKIINYCKRIKSTSYSHLFLMTGLTYKKNSKGSENSKRDLNSI